MKLVPVESRADVVSNRAPLLFTMLIAFTPLAHGELLIAPVTPLMVVEALVNVTEPKFASGNTPENEDGASTIHSADDRWKLDPLLLMLKELLPAGSDRSVMVRVNCPLVGL